ncbi:MAG: hypothetical protein RL653_2740 [Pseudomonadota bacterium]
MDPDVVATVNGEPLSRADFERELRRALGGFETQPSPEQLEQLRNSLVESMTESMVLEQAIRKNAVTVTQEEVDKRLMQARADYGADGLEQALEESEQALAEFKRNTRGLLLLERLFQEQVYARVAVTDEELLRYHGENAKAFEQGEQVHALQLVVKTQEEARKLLQKLRDGKRFGELAMKYSLSPDATVGGDLGWFERGVMPPKFDEVCFSLGKGETSGVVESEYGYHLFKVVERRPARVRSFKEVRAAVEARVLKEKRSAAQAAYVAELKKQATIRINREALAAAGGGRT